MKGDKGLFVRLMRSYEITEPIVGHHLWAARHDLAHLRKLLRKFLSELARVAARLILQ